MSTRWEGGYFYTKYTEKNSLKCRFEIWAKLDPEYKIVFIKTEWTELFLGKIRIKSWKCDEEVEKNMCVWSCGRVQRVWVEQGIKKGLVMRLLLNNSKANIGHCLVFLFRFFSPGDCECGILQKGSQISKLVRFMYFQTYTYITWRFRVGMEWTKSKNTLNNAEAQNTKDWLVEGKRRTHTSLGFVLVSFFHLSVCGNNSKDKKRKKKSSHVCRWFFECVWGCEMRGKEKWGSIKIFCLRQFSSLSLSLWE